MMSIIFFDNTSTIILRIGLKKIIKVHFDYNIPISSVDNKYIWLENDFNNLPSNSFLEICEQTRCLVTDCNRSNDVMLLFSCAVVE